MRSTIELLLICAVFLFVIYSPECMSAEPLFCGDLGTLYSQADFNEDCRVDLGDISIYAAMWMGASYEPPKAGVFNGIDINRIKEHIIDFELPALPNENKSPVLEIQPGQSIQNAIDQLAAADGGVVKLLKGNHYIENTIYLKSSIMLEGEGNESVIIRASGSELEYMVYTAGGIADVVLKDFKIDGAVDWADRNWIWQVDSDQAWPMGLFILDDNRQRNSRVAIYRVHITRTAMGFHSKGTDDLIVSGMKAYDNGGVDLYFHNGYLRRNERVLVRNSEFADSHTGNGLNLTLQRNIMIKDNIFGNNNFRGVRAANTENIVIEGNKAFNNGDFGIGTRSEDGGVNWYMLVNNYSWNNMSNYSMSSANNGFEENNSDAPPVGWVYP